MWSSERSQDFHEKTFRLGFFRYFAVMEEVAKTMSWSPRPGMILHVPVRDGLLVKKYLLNAQYKDRITVHDKVVKMFDN